MASPEVSFKACSQLAVQAFSVVKGKTHLKARSKGLVRYMGPCLIPRDKFVFFRDKSLTAGVGSHSSTHIYLLPRIVIR